MSRTVPQTVVDAFRISGDPDEALGSSWDYGIRYAGVVLAEVADPARARTSAELRDVLQIDGVRCAKPLRATDGRVIVGGWKASTFTPGPRASNIDELVMIGLRLDDALSAVEVPSFTHDRIAPPWEVADVFRIADQAAWSPQPSTVLEPGLDLDAEPTPALHWALTMAARLQDSLDPELLQVPQQVCHADLVGTTITPQGQAPVITDIVCVARPYGYTSALAMVDGLLAEVVDDGVLTRHTNIPHIRQMMLRALLYRVFVHALHPEATPAMRTHIERVENLLTERG
ncbi:TIGR02569 family protein [Corynebacterium sp. 13CS0277]|uniref:TIGR02569 family protein n=1 Tax=Corynebacterium sp. 13CS0277 TaxID=2071994 RepID=UPI000D0266CD|nr:TIGR02569 family protein [Corynebacterium sp. 13CS0277]PRQ11460.1 TIGR02569 family protein [Corynebacterium sp. 13CS0277]